MSKQEHLQIRLAAASLGVGENSYNIDCPFCNQNQNGSFSVTRVLDMGLLYNCFRLKCGKSGFIPCTSSDKNTSNNTPKKKKPKLFTDATGPLPDYVHDYLALTYGLDAEHIRLNEIKWIPEKEAICYPLYKINHFQWGTQVKFIDDLATKKHGGPKNITYKEDLNALKMSYAFSTNSVNAQGMCDTLVVVEDVLSSIRIIPYADSCAMLGTNISEACVNEWFDAGYRRIFICFDPDATQKAIEYAKQWGPVFDVCRAINLQNDVKDLNKELFDGLVKKIKTNGKTNT